MTIIYLLVNLISAVAGAFIYRLGVKDGLKRTEAEKVGVTATLDPVFKETRPQPKVTDDQELFELAMNYSGAKPLRDLKQGD